MIQKNTVIVCGDVISNILGDIRSFGELGYYVYVVWLNPCHIPHTPKDSKYISEFYEFANIEAGMDFLQKKFQNNTSTKYLLSVGADDIMAYLNRNYEIFSKLFVFFHWKSPDYLRLMQKEEMCSVAEKVGLKVPKLRIVDISESTPIPDIQFPIFIKAANSLSPTWKAQTKICENKDDLLAYYKTHLGKSVICQEFVKKKTEYHVEGISLNYGEHVYIPIQGKYFRAPDNGYGSYQYLEPYNYGEDLYNKLVSLMKETHYTGVFEIEFLETEDGKLYFLEINFRYTAFHHCLVKMGVNLSKIWADYEYTGTFKPIPKNRIKPYHIIMNEFLDVQQIKEIPHYNLFHWCKDILHTDGFYVFDRHDIKPFLFYIYDSVFTKYRK